jgi:hypothetical protein
LINVTVNATNHYFRNDSDGDSGGLDAQRHNLAPAAGVFGPSLLAMTRTLARPSSYHETIS